MENSAAFQLFPLHRVSFQGHVAVGAVLFGDAHRTRIQVKISLPELCPGRNMGMPVQQHISRGQRRQIFYMIEICLWVA